MMMMMKVMKLLQQGPSSAWCIHCGILKISRVLPYSTEVVANSSASRGSLYSRISPLGDPKVSITPSLDQWVEEGRGVHLPEFKDVIKQLRNFRRFKQALEVSEWMNDKNHFEPSSEDVAIRLDLISKVHGLEQAEEYFNSLPNSLKDFKVYGALLNCYAHAKSLEKAEATMQKMKEMGFARRVLAYNAMLNLYLQMGKYEKLDALVGEVEEKGIAKDLFTYSIQLNARAANSDAEGIEKILEKLEADPGISIDWNVYAVAANGYLKAGLKEKALEMLKKLERLIKVKTRRFAYEILLTLYARSESKDEVYRIWNLSKKAGRIYNSGYICMISSLAKMDDLGGAEAIYEEWEAKRTSFDLRIPNLLISAYCKKGLLEKAESIVNRLIESGKEPTASTWDRLATGYHNNNHITKAVDTMKKAVLAIHPGWKPKLSTLAGCLEYLKGKGDAEVAEFRALLDKHSQLSTDMYDRLEEFMKNPGIKKT